jgi:hypothetical protein
MAQIRTHCLKKIQDTFDNYDWKINNFHELEKINTIFDTDITEFIRIYRITSPTWQEEILKMPELMEKSIYNASIKEARTKFIERSWSNPHFKTIYTKNYIF